MYQWDLLMTIGRLPLIPPYLAMMCLYMCLLRDDFPYLLWNNGCLVINEVTRYLLKVKVKISVLLAGSMPQ